MLYTLFSQSLKLWTRIGQDLLLVVIKREREVDLTINCNKAPYASINRLNKAEKSKSSHAQPITNSNKSKVGKALLNRKYLKKEVMMTRNGEGQSGYKKFKIHLQNRQIISIEWKNENYNLFDWSQQCSCFQKPMEWTDSFFLRYLRYFFGKIDPVQTFCHVSLTRSIYKSGIQICLKTIICMYYMEVIILKWWPIQWFCRPKFSPVFHDIEY